MKLYLPLLDNGQGDIKADFLDCFLRAFSGSEITTVRFSDSHPGRARNRVAAAFLRSDCDYLLFIDGDVKFERRHIELLAESDAPILGGIYCLKTEETKPCLQTLPGSVPVECGGTNPYLPVARAGTGFLRISREVLDAMHETGAAERYDNHGLPEWDFFQSGVVNGEWLSEDWFFCDQARSLGFEVLIDTRIQLLHRGEIDYPIRKTPERLHLCPPEMKPHIERIWQGEYLVRGSAPRAVLDVGANIGGFTEWACETWPECTVVAYEPHPDNTALFRLNTRHRGGRVTLHCLGVCEDGGEKTLCEGGNCGEHSFAFGDAGGPRVSTVDPSALPPCDFLKIDTEGCEIEIINGYPHLAAVSVVALEYHSAADLEPIRALLGGAGFIERDHEALAADRGILKFSR